jgi:hypothetical protein
MLQVHDFPFRSVSYKNINNCLKPLGINAVSRVDYAILGFFFLSDLELTPVFKIVMTHV